MTGLIKLTLRLSDADYEELEYIAKANEISRTDAIRRAIHREGYITRQLRRGSKLLLKDSRGNTYEMAVRDEGESL